MIEQEVAGRLPRRAFGLGLGSLAAAVAALGFGRTAGEAKKKPKGKKSRKPAGTLLRTEVVTGNDSISALSNESFDVLCTEPGAGERVVALSGGWSFGLVALDVLSTFPVETEVGWRFSIRNPFNQAVNAQGRVVCGYFRA